MTDRNIENNSLIMSSMSQERKITLGHLLVVTVILLAFSVRLFQLGESPLADREARAALSAVHFLDADEAAGPGDQPAYSAATALIYFALGDSNFTARLLPALAGGLLACLPFLFIGPLGMVPALLIALGLALDPVLVGDSRLAGSATLAAGLLLAAAALRMTRALPFSTRTRRVLSSVLAGLALLSGPDVFSGILILLFAWAGFRAIAGQALPAEGEEGPGAGRLDLHLEVVPFVGTLVLAATLFLRFPEGIGALAASLPAYLRGWSGQAVTPGRQVLFALLGYQAVPVVFALVQTWRGWRGGSAIARFLSIWAASGLVILLLYPARQVGDLVWVLVPLWGLAGMEFGRREIWANERVFQPLVLAAAILVLVISFWTNLAGFSYIPTGDPQVNLRLLIMAGTVLLAALSIALVTLGWSPEAARSGTVWGIGIALLLGMLAGIWGTSHRSAAGLRELWYPGSLPGDAGLLDETLERVGSWDGIGAVSLQIVDEVGTPSVAWALRDLETTPPALPAAGTDLPDVILTEPDGLDPRLAPAYRGQGLTWQVEPGWDQMRSMDWLRWWLFKEAPAVNREIVVWVRADLFLSSSGDQTNLFPMDAIEDPPPEEAVPLEDVEELFPDN